MEHWKPAAAVVLAGLVSACAQDRVTATQPLPSQTIGPSPMLTLLDFGKLGGQSYTLLTSLQVHNQEGKLAVCGATQVLARVDLSPNIRDGFAYKKTTLTLTPDSKQVEVRLSPGFLPVTYRQSTDGKFKPADIGAIAANCVLTEEAWSEQWGNPNFHGKLALYVRNDMRARSQTVVGAAGASR